MKFSPEYTFNSSDSNDHNYALKSNLKKKKEKEEIGKKQRTSLDLSQIKWSKESSLKHKTKEGEKFLSGQESGKLLSVV